VVAVVEQVYLNQVRLRLAVLAVAEREGGTAPAAPALQVFLELQTLAAAVVEIPMVQLKAHRVPAVPVS
jgi:hypothetical protein